MSKTLDTNTTQFTHSDHVSTDKCASVRRRSKQQLAIVHIAPLLNNFRHLHIFCRISCLFVVCISYTINIVVRIQYMIEFSFCRCGRHPHRSDYLRWTAKLLFDCQFVLCSPLNNVIFKATSPLRVSLCVLCDGVCSVDLFNGSKTCGANIVLIPQYQLLARLFCSKTYCKLQIYRVYSTQNVFSWCWHILRYNFME